MGWGGDREVAVGGVGVGRTSVCLGRASRSYQGHTEPLKRDLHWICVEGLGDTMLVLHVDSQTRACSKDQCFFLAVKRAVSVKQSPDLGRTQRTRKKQNKPLGGGWNAVGGQMCHGARTWKRQMGPEAQSSLSLPKLELQGGSCSGALSAGENVRRGATVAIGAG